MKSDKSALAGELLRISNRGGGKVDNDRFTLELLESLVRGGKDSQAIIIGDKGKVGASLSVSAHDTDITAELESLRRTLKDTQRDLLDKSEKLEAVISERDKLRRMTVIDISGDEPIKHILSVLATEYDDESTTGMLSPTSHFKEEPKRIKELSSEVERLSLSVNRLTKELDSKSIELETALETNRSLRGMLRTTPDIDDDTIHYIIQNIISFDNQRIEECDDDEDAGLEEASRNRSVARRPSAGLRERACAAARRRRPGTGPGGRSHGAALAGHGGRVADAAEPDSGSAGSGLGCSGWAGAARTRRRHGGGQLGACGADAEDRGYRGSRGERGDGEPGRAESRGVCSEFIAADSHAGHGG